MSKILNKKIWVIKVGEPAVYNKKYNNIKPLRSAMLVDQLSKNKCISVTWWTSNFQHHSKDFVNQNTRSYSEYIKNIKSIYLDSSGYKNNISLKRIIDHKSIANDFKKRSVLEPKPDLIICSWPTIELAYEAYRYAKKNNIIFVIDIRDMWPDVIYDALNNSLYAKFVINTFLKYDQKLIECFSNSNLLISVSESIQEWAIKKSNRSYQKDNLVSRLSCLDLSKINYNVDKIASFWNNLNVKSDLEITRIIFVGTLLKQQLFIDFIRSNINFFKKNNIQVVICGTGQLENFFKSNHYENIVYAGFINLQQYAHLCKISDYGLAPFLTRKDLSMSIPNKIGEYLSGGLGIISSGKNEVKRLLSSSERFNDFDISNKIDCERFLFSLTKKVVADRLKRNKSYQLYDELFNAEKNYKNLSEYLIRYKPKL